MARRREQKKTKKNLPSVWRDHYGKTKKNASKLLGGGEVDQSFVRGSSVSARCGAEAAGLGGLARAAIGRVLALRGRMLMADRAVCLINF
jgi:hypothetical protein